MAKYKLKPMILEAISFQEFIDYGKRNTENIYNGIPWSFDFLGRKVTHETDDSYIISSYDGTNLLFTKNQMLLIENNELVPMNIDQFNQTCEPLEV